jgi:hypothetical protein
VCQTAFFLKRVRVDVKKAISFVTSVCQFACTSAAPTARILVKFHDGDFNENLSRKSKFDSTRTKIPITLHEDVSTLCCWWPQTCVVEHCLATVNIFVLLTVTCVSTVHTESIVAFSWQQPYANAQQYYLMRTFPILLLCVLRCRQSYSY